MENGAAAAIDTGQFKELFIHDGVLLRKAGREHAEEFNTTGTLVFLSFEAIKTYAIEWRPNDGFLISDTDTQEQDEWSFVDTIAKRSRTVSECLIFDTATNNISVRSSPNNSVGNENGTGLNNSSEKSRESKRNRNVRVLMSQLKCVEVLRNGQIVRLISQGEIGKVHSEFLFQHGNADSFIRAMSAYCLTKRNRSVYEVVLPGTDEDPDQEKLEKTFATLQIDDIKSGGQGWISNIVRRPYEQTLDMFAKIGGGIGINPSADDQSPKSPTSKPIPKRNDMLHSTTTEDYELLSTSPRVSLPSQISVGGGKISDLKSPKLPERIIKPRGPRLSKEDWLKAHAEDGSFTEAMVESIKRRIFEGGIEDSIRIEVWKFLLDYDVWSNSARQKELRRAQKNSEYYIMKSQWLRMSAVQENNFSDYRDRKCQIQKDVKRTDRTLEFFAGDDNPNLETLNEILMTYVMYNFDLGYVQGMNDLLAPILFVMKNEKDAFWCFVGFMDRVFRNFDMDQEGMKRQLRDLNKLIAFVNPKLYNYFKATGSDNMFFCFRWLLVWFKREFSPEDIMTLWEVLWTGLPGPNYHLFIGLAILDDQMRIFIDNEFEFNEILKHVNELSMQIDLDSTLAKADAIYQQVATANHLPEEIRLILGLEPNENGAENCDSSKDKDLDEEEDDEDDIQVASPVKSFEEEEKLQKKIEEALEQSMYFAFY